MADWKCRGCDIEGNGLPPEDGCPDPECRYDVMPTETGFTAMMPMYKWAVDRARRVAAILGFGCDSVEFDTDNSFMVTWEASNCRRGCCGRSTHREDIPLRYLWATEDEIQHELTLKKDAEAKAEEEKARQKAVEGAKREVERAQLKVANAEAEALKRLSAAKANLAALEK